MSPDLFYGYNVPEEIKVRVSAIMKRFIINGLCDGMYIANVIAHETGCGNGAGEFTGVPNFDREECRKLALILQKAYGCNILKEYTDELEDILFNGTLDNRRARTGICEYIKALKAEMCICDEWRVGYLQKQIMEARYTIAGLEAV